MFACSFLGAQLTIARLIVGNQVLEEVVAGDDNEAKSRIFKLISSTYICTVCFGGFLFLVNSWFNSTIREQGRMISSPFVPSALNPRLASVHFFHDVSSDDS